jgi:hypothetical protein
LQTENAELRCDSRNGHFVFIDLGEWEKDPLFPVGDEPVLEEDIVNDGLDVLFQLDVPEKEIAGVSVRRIVEQGEDTFGGLLEKETSGFIFYVKREIDGYPVSGSSAKLLFSADGMLRKVTVKWRPVEEQRNGNVTVKDETELHGSAYGIVEAKAKRIRAAVDVFYGGIGYVEEYPGGDQSGMTPWFLYRYSIGGGPLVFEDTSAAIEGGVADEK